MNSDWDSDRGGRDAWVAWMTDVLRESLRVVKPGGYALVWSLPRTSHWTHGAPRAIYIRHDLRDSAKPPP